MDAIDRRLMQLQMERLSVSRDQAADKSGGASGGVGVTAETGSSDGTTASARLRDLDAKIEALQRQQQELRGRWDLERAGLEKLQNIKNQVTGLIRYIH